MLLTSTGSLGTELENTGGGAPRVGVGLGFREEEECMGELSFPGAYAGKKGSRGVP